LLASKAFVVDACRHVVRDESEVLQELGEGKLIRRRRGVTLAATC
jgi:hypothetical protein